MSEIQPCLKSKLVWRNPNLSEIRKGSDFRHLLCLALDTLMGFPFSLAPWPLIAVYILSITGAKTMPMTIRLLTTKATEIETIGCEWTKFMVPSIGSMIQVGSLPKSLMTPSAAAVVSSPMNLWLGKIFLKTLRGKNDIKTQPKKTDTVTISNPN